MERFETIKFNKTVTLEKEGMEISAYIAGVNSGVYQLPYVIQVRVWAKKWFFKKFFHKEMHLNLWEVKQLRDECNKVIEFYNARENNETSDKQ